MAMTDPIPSNGSTLTVPCGHCGHCERCLAHRRHVEDEEMSEQGYVASWPHWRTAVAKVMSNPIFDCFLCLVVFYNLVVVVAETDYRAKHRDDDSSLFWVDMSNHVLITFYAVEFFLRVAIYGRHLLRDRTNIFDGSLIGFDLLMLPVAALFGNVISISFLRVFRLARLGRSWRLMKLSPELAILLKGLASTAKSIAIGALLIFLMLTVSSVVAVEFIQPVNLEVARLTNKYDGCDRCAHAFDSVMESNLTFFQQLIAGDSWGTVTIPVIEQSPVTAFFFVVVHVAVAIGLMNLLLAVIVDRASQARSEDKKGLLREERQEKKRLGNHLMKVCGELDTDGSKTLSLQELQDGWSENDDFQTTMQAMDVGEEDISAIFNILDSDGSGHVNYEEFVDQLWKMKSTDQQTMLIFIKYFVCDIRNKQADYMKNLEVQLLQDYGSIKEKLTSLVNTEKQEMVRLEQIQQDTAEVRKSCTGMSPGPMQSPEPGRGEASRVIADVGAPWAVTALVKEETQEIVALRCMREDMSAMLRQCLAHLQQLTRTVGTRDNSRQQLDLRQKRFPESLYSCFEASKAPPSQDSLLVVPASSSLGLP